MPTPNQSDDTIHLLIRTLRGQSVILDTDLAALYGVPTFRFNEAFKRNRNRFPPDFVFQLTAVEFAGFEIANCDLKPGTHWRRRTWPELVAICDQFRATN